MSAKLAPDEIIRLDALPEPPVVMRYALSRGERIRRYGKDDGVPLHVGDVFMVGDQRQLKVTAIIDKNTIRAQPVP